MKKTLIVIMFTALVSISVVLMTPKKAKAETTQDITPFYGGDLLDGAELYLFQDYTETPNFENGYLSKKTISSQDVYYSNSVATHFNGWYKDLGMSLIDDYTTEETAYFWFYIPFNDLLGRYFQLALVVSTPFEGDYVVKLKDESPRTILTSGDMSQYLLMIDQGDKYVEWFAYQVYYPDYLTSFRALTAELAYKYGFDSGETEGFTSGYNSGYNYGYSVGYDNGLIDAQENGYLPVFDFNQIIRNGDFQTTQYWNKSNESNIFTVSDGVATINISVPFANINQNISVKQNHKYYVSFYCMKDNENSNFVLQDNINAVTWTQINNLEWTRKTFIRTASSTKTASLLFQLNNGTQGNLFVKKVIVIDLTQMFGENYEPDLERCNEIFSIGFYDYTLSTPISLNYLDGYNEGVGDGYTKGSNAEATKQLTATGWIQNIFSGMGSLLGLQIFPGVTIGLIVGIPFVISLAYFVIRAFRGGGGA